MKIVHYNEPIATSPVEAIRFREVAISACPLGCKVYEHDTTGEQVLAHNGAYGCKR